MPVRLHRNSVMILKQRKRKYWRASTRLSNSQHSAFSITEQFNFFLTVILIIFTTFLLSLERNGCAMAPTVKWKKISLSVCSVYENKSKLMIPKVYFLFSALLQKALEISTAHKSLGCSANLVITLIISCPSLGFENLLITANALHTLQT